MVTVNEAFERLWPAVASLLSDGTSRGYLVAWRLRVAPTFGVRELAEVTAFDVELAFASWSGSVSTRKDAVAMLSALCRAAMKARLIAANPCVGVEYRRRQAHDPTSRALSRREVDRLFEVLPREGCYRRFVIALLYTGCRFGEVAGLRVGDVDLEGLTIRVQRTASPGSRGEIVVGPTKGRRVRDVPIPEPFVPELLAAMEGKGEHDYLFTGPRGGFLSSGNLSRALDWPRVRERVKTFPPGEPALHWHDLRHTAATNLFFANVPATDVQAIMGHSDLATTQRYADTRRDSARRGGAALTAYYGQSNGRLRGGESPAKTADYRDF
ncbi:site-specific integrase [Agromyces protaetiae]|uniref:Site-specific integrase n=1 Tax=Agromyces protaetiae TaxID=2509455 RepID=A0A4P6FBF4_9MICO|nr:site-specific integrase [Agromyces protaetiae]QAY73075.1 site-specific integrase [Agromyces protaetiae]